MSNNEKPNRPWVPIQILAVSFLFGPAAAGAVTGINFNRLGKPKFLLPCIIAGTVLFLLEALALVFVVPDDLCLHRSRILKHGNQQTGNLQRKKKNTNRLTLDSFSWWL